MATTSFEEQRKTKKNQESDILEARVIANYGDPGLDEDYHFDILSRYIVVMIESYQRVPTRDKYSGMIVLVKRPPRLWINASSIPNGNPTQQQRTDADQNVGVGPAAAYSSNGISRIYPAYAFGESIRIRRLSVPVKPPDDYFFHSDFSDSITPYGAWHSEGSTLPYFSTEKMKNNLRQKALAKTSDSNYYSGLLTKFQYEAFILYLSLGNQKLTKGMTSLFSETHTNNSWTGTDAAFSAHGGYLFQEGTSYITLDAVGYEDINIGHKERVTSNDCMPLVVTTPNSFPIPSSRVAGTILYNPTYSPISS